jgi:long-chain fatty acid transport protein
MRIRAKRVGLLRSCTAFGADLEGSRSWVSWAGLTPSMGVCSHTWGEGFRNPPPGALDLGRFAHVQFRGVGRRTVLLFWMMLLCTIDVDAVGFRLPNQDPEAIARGNAFVATANNPSAIYYNPAGITQLEGQNLRVGIYLLSTGIDYESPTGAKAKADSDFNPVPELYYVVSPKNVPLSFGLGVYVPYGLSMDWGQNTSFRTLAEKGSLLYTSINPVVAWQIHPTLSIGIGPTLNYSKATFERGILPASLSTQDKFRFDGDDFDCGFNAGVRWQPHKKWAFGVSYRYLTTLNYTGHSEVQSPFLPPAFNRSSPTSAEIRFPQFVVAGLSYRPTENWNLEFDIDWTDWDNVNQIVFHGTPVGDQTFALNYRSSLMYEFGVTRKLGAGYFASVGYFYSENSSPDQNFNPIIPDSDLHLGSVGFGYKGSRWDWAIAYHFGYNPGREVTNNQPNPLSGETANGTYHILNHAVNISATFKF